MRRTIIATIIASTLGTGLALATLVTDARAEFRPKSTSDTARQTRTDKPASPAGPGTPTSGLSYISVPTSAFTPGHWNDDNLELQRSQNGIAPVVLPHGSRIKEVACFSEFHSGSPVHLGRTEMATGTSSSVVGTTFLGGEGRRRVEGKCDHVVDSFKYAYQLEVNHFPTKDLMCRIGYIPA
jgi:hypothetical protein